MSTELINSSTADGMITSRVDGSWAQVKAGANLATTTADNSRDNAIGIKRNDGDASYDRRMWRSFFKFDLSALKGTAVEATIIIYGVTNAEVDVIAVASGAGATLQTTDWDTAFTAYSGSHTWALGNNWISLNAAALTAINAAIGSTYLWIQVMDKDNDYDDVDPPNPSEANRDGVEYADNATNYPKLKLRFNSPKIVAVLD